MNINKEAYIVASYWYACNYHSENYISLCNSQYKPSPLTEGILDEDDLAIGYYIALVQKYNYELPKPELEYLQYGCVDTLQSHRGFIIALDIMYSENSQDILEALKNSFWSYIDSVEGGLYDCFHSNVNEINERLDELFDYLPPSHVLASEGYLWIKATI